MVLFLRLKDAIYYVANAVIFKRNFKSFIKNVSEVNKLAHI